MRILASIFLFVVTGGVDGQAAGAAFPGDTKAVSVSPNKQWSVRCESQDQSDGAALHALFLSLVGGAKVVPVWTSGRWCEPLWSADSQRIAVTDWVGSNVSEILLIDLATPSKAVSLDVQNIQAIVSKVELTGHCYYEAVAWEGSQELLIRVFGHTDESEREGRGFTYYLSVNTASGLARLVMKIDAEMGGGP